jgi:hypothetical protein
LCKEDLNSNGNQFHQYQQNELKQDLSNQLNSLNTRQSTTNDIGNPGLRLGQSQTFGGLIKNKIYHTVGTVPKSNRKTKYTTPSEQFLNQISKSLTNKCISGHFSDLVQAQQVGMLSWFAIYETPHIKLKIE